MARGSIVIKAALAIALLSTFVLSLAVVAIFVLSGSPASGEAGTLSGKVTIGPLAPVVRIGEPEPTPAPEAFEAISLVARAKSFKLATPISIKPQGAYGTFSVELPPGDYVLEVSKDPYMGSNLPMSFTVYSGQITAVDVYFDTGIR